MGFDVSFHPIDSIFIRDQIVPIMVGEKDPTELYERAARAAKIRFLANAWGLGLVQFQHEQSRAQREASNKSFIARFLDRNKPQDFDTLSDFESDLYVWGRPYFITSTEDASLFDAIDRYSDLTPQDVDGFARSMIDNRWPKIAARVRKDESSTIPSDEDFLHGVSWKIELLREAVKAIHDGTKVQLPDGDEHDPVELLSNETQMAVLELHSVFVPGWMGRGRVAPTQLLDQAGRESKVVETSDMPFASVSDAIPELSLRSDSTIHENFMVGGYVAPGNVAAFQREVESVETEVLSAADREGWKHECEVVLRKIIEALVDSQRRGIGFVEASEIYSAPMGVMN